ncbi:hypothetical protein N9937_00985 [bacterium]|nr:hypothetical protein [bacterium]
MKFNKTSKYGHPDYAGSTMFYMCHDKWSVVMRFEDSGGLCTFSDESMAQLYKIQEPVENRIVAFRKDLLTNYERGVYANQYLAGFDRILKKHNLEIVGAYDA